MSNVVFYHFHPLPFCLLNHIILSPVVLAVTLCIGGHFLVNLCMKATLFDISYWQGTQNFMPIYCSLFAEPCHAKLCDVFGAGRIKLRSLTMNMYIPSPLMVIV